MTDFIDFNNDLIPVVVTTNTIGGDVANALQIATAASSAAAAEALAASQAAEAAAAIAEQAAADAIEDIAAVSATGGDFALNYPDADTRTPLARFDEMPISVGEFSSLVVPGVGGLPDDWTAAIQAALDADRNVYLPGRVGGYYVKDELLQRAAGNYIVGDGVEESYLVIDRDFDMGSLGVMRIPTSASENQAGLHDVGFEFAQPGDNYISAIAVSAGGSGYTSVPTVTISGGGGSGAMARAVLTAGAVSSIVITRNGTGYTTDPTVTITGGGGTGATAGAITRVASVARANVVQYPYALSARGVSRMMLGNIRITGGYNGLDLRDNTGGLMGGRWEIGCINEGVTGGGADGGTPALDFWHVDTIHVWPFGWADAGRLAVWQDGSTSAATLGRIDGLDVKTFSMFSAQVEMVETSGEGPFGNIGALQCDGRQSRLIFNGGRMVVNGGYKSTDLAGDFWLQLLGGHFSHGPWYFTASGGGSTPVVLVDGCEATFAPGVAGAFGPATPAFKLTSGVLNICSSQFGASNNPLTNQNRTVGCIVQETDGTLIACDNSFSVIGTGSGPAIEVGFDNFHVVTGNSLQGWGLTLPAFNPATGYAGVYEPNSGSTRFPKRIRVVAAADPISPLYTDEVIQLTGAATIGTIEGGYPGQELTLQFTGVVTINGNAAGQVLRGGKAFTSAAGDTLSIVYDGTVWRERARSVGATVTSTLSVATIGANSGALADASGTINYQNDQSGWIKLGFDLNIVDIGTAADWITLALPVAANGTVIQAGGARDVQGSKGSLVWTISPGSPSIMQINADDGSFPAVNGSRLCGSLIYWVG